MSRDVPVVMTPESDRGENAKKPLFGAWATLLIGFVLVVPFALITFADLEPYPAVIFPGGGGISTTLDGDIATFYGVAIVGEAPDGSEVRIDRSELLDPIPPSHLEALIGTSFGQDKTSFRDVRIRGFDIDLRVARHVPDGEQRAIAREWLSERLRNLGLEPDRLVARTERVTVDHSTGEVLEREIVEEVDILG